MMKQLLNSITSQNIVICQCLADQLFAKPKADKSRYIVQPRAITVN